MVLLKKEGKLAIFMYHFQPFDYKILSFQCLDSPYPRSALIQHHQQELVMRRVFKKESHMHPRGKRRFEEVMTRLYVAT